MRVSTNESKKRFSQWFNELCQITLTSRGDQTLAENMEKNRIDPILSELRQIEEKYTAHQQQLCYKWIGKNIEILNIYICIYSETSVGMH